VARDDAFWDHVERNLEAQSLPHVAHFERVLLHFSPNLEEQFPRRSVPFELLWCGEQPLHVVNAVADTATGTS
jgi:hypothetical protein